MTRLTFVFVLSVCAASVGCGAGADGSAAGGEGATVGSGGAAGVGPARSKSNVCPSLLLLDCADPQADGAPAPPPGADEGAITCEVRFRDDDGTCAQSCDPQTCIPTAGGLECSAGPDLGVSTTIVCLGGDLDCTGDGDRDASCIVDSDVLVGAPELPTGSVECDDDDDCGFEGARCVAGFCDFSALVPTLNANFYVTCPPLGVGGAGGGGAPPEQSVTCAAVTTDGDVDCDQQLTIEVPCTALE